MIPSITRILISIVFVGTVGITHATAQTYGETLNYIFNSDKQWGKVQYGIFQSMHNSLSNYNEDNCTVEIDSGPSTIKGTIFLKNIRRWSWRPLVQEGLKVGGILTLENDGQIFDGFYTPNAMRPIMGVTSRKDCFRQCMFYTPQGMEMWRMEAAFKHLWENYCPPEKGNSAF